MINEKILVLNAGSSSIKFQVYDFDEKVLAKGLCERIFLNDGVFQIEINSEKNKKLIPFPTYQAAFECILKHLKMFNVINNFDEIIGAGHRIVQGGSYFKNSTLINPTVLEKIIEYSTLAPLHNKPEADVIKVVMEMIPNCRNVAVFDTTFHTTIPEKNYKYAIPQEWETKYLIRRYGFHGTSFRYITERMEQLLNRKPLNLIVCHLGNGASICAIKKSKSYNTSMGFTPLEGLIMGTRSGDIDASVVEYVMQQSALTANEVVSKLNKASGLLGLTGSSDMRDVCADVQKNQVALAMYAERIANYIAQYWNQLEGDVDAIVFTAGVGENSSDTVVDICNALKGLKIKIDSNQFVNKYDDARLVSSSESLIPVYQVRTNEELMIMRDVKTFGKLKS